MSAITVASSSRRRASDTTWTSRAICSRTLSGLSANQTKLIAQLPYSPRYNRHDVSSRPAVRWYTALTMLTSASATTHE